ncbi:hypothetical protein [Pseudomonas fluorescens group sp. PF-69]
MDLYPPMRPWPTPVPAEQIKWGNDLVADFKSLPPLTADEQAAIDRRGRLVELLREGKISLPEREYGPKTWMLE